MQNEEQDLIAHLLEVEEQASELILHAQEENDAFLAKTRAAADSEYNEKFKAMCALLDEDYSKKIAALDAERAATVNSYKEEISKTQKNIEAFEKAVGLYLQSE